MPLCEVEHCTPLTRRERDDIARSITHIHIRHFTTPSLFVNVRFIDISNLDMYVAGEKGVNRVIGLVRGGSTRTTRSFEELAERIVDAWGYVLNAGKKVHGNRQLSVLSIQASITAGVEHGFTLPPAGGDASWLKKNRPAFGDLASKGSSDFASVVREMREREDLA